MSSPGKLTDAEYERRKTFHGNLKSLTKAENIEILRVLQRGEETFSENLNGIFFNVVSLKQETFDALELFLNFTHSNRRDLVEREMYMSSLKHLLPTVENPTVQ